MALGERVNAFAPRRWRQRLAGGERRDEHGACYRLARAVQRRTHRRDPEARAARATFTPLPPGGDDEVAEPQDVARAQLGTVEVRSMAGLGPAISTACARVRRARSAAWQLCRRWGFHLTGVE